MRFVLALTLLAFVGTGIAVANPDNAEPKDWVYPLDWARDTYPEAEPNNTCAQAQGTVCGDVVDPAQLTVADRDWYSFSVNAGIPITVGTDAASGGLPTVDTYIDLIASDCTTVLASDDDSGPGLFSLIQNFNAPYTGIYYLRVRGYTDNSTGYYKAFFNCTPPPPPPENDRCEGAINIPCGTGSLQGNVAQAVNDYNPPSQCTGYSANGRDVVYYVDLNPGDILEMTYTQLAFDTSFYVVTDCANLASCVAGADDTLTGEPEYIYYVAGAADRYYIILDVYGTNTGGAWVLDYNIVCAQPEPEACCFQDGSCTMLFADDCTAAGGVPQGAGTDCDPNPCDVVGTQETTWGQIRSIYR